MGELGDKAEGNLKDAGGKLTGDKKTELEGKAQKGKGKAEELANDVTGNERVSEEPGEGDRKL